VTEKFKELSCPQRVAATQQHEKMVFPTAVIRISFTIAIVHVPGVSWVPEAHEIRAEQNNNECY